MIPFHRFLWASHHLGAEAPDCSLQSLNPSSGHLHSATGQQLSKATLELWPTSFMMKYHKIGHTGLGVTEVNCQQVLIWVTAHTRWKLRLSTCRLGQLAAGQQPLKKPSSWLNSPPSSPLKSTNNSTPSNPSPAASTRRATVLEMPITHHRSSAEPRYAFRDVTSITSLTAEDNTHRWGTVDRPDHELLPQRGLQVLVIVD